MVLAEHSKARYKQASTKEMRSPAVVLGSLEPLIPEPVRFPQLFGNRWLHLDALVIRHLRCDPCRHEGTGSSSYKCRFVPSGFLSRLPSWGEGSFLSQLWRRFTLFLSKVQTLDAEQEALVDWAVLQLSGSEGKCQRTRLGVKDFSTQVGNKFEYLWSGSFVTAPPTPCSV